MIRATEDATKPRLESGMAVVSDVVGVAPAFVGVTGQHVRHRFWMVVDGDGEEWLRHESELHKIKKAS